MTQAEYEEIKKILEKSKTPMWFNTNFPILCITNSTLDKALKEIKEMVVEE